MGTLEQAVDRSRRRFQGGGHLRPGKAEHVPQDQDGALTGRQMLERRDERQLDRLALQVASLGAAKSLIDTQFRVRIWLNPGGLRERRAERGVRVGRGPIVDRQHPDSAPLDHSQTDVRGDRVEPGTQRAAALKPPHPAPGVQQGLLNRVLGVLHRPEHPVTVRKQLTPMGLELLAECSLVGGYRSGSHGLGMDDAIIGHLFLPSGRHAAAGTSVAFCRSISLTGLPRQLSARVWESGSGKISSSPRSTPSKIARATDSGLAFGT